MSLLLDNGADPNVPDNFGTTPLHFAVTGGKTDLVRLLLSHAADPNIAAVRPDITCHPLHATCRNLKEPIHYEVVKLLLEYNADVNVRAEFDESALHYAVSRYSTGNDKRSELVHLLVDAGADVNAASEKRGTPLYIACSNGFESSVQNVKLVDMLLKHGADPNLASPSSRLHSTHDPLCVAVKNVSGYRPNQSTEEMGHKLSTVRLLLQNGAYVNMLMPFGRSLLYLTVTALGKAGVWRDWRHEYSVNQLLKLMVKHGAQLDDSCCQLGDDVDDYPQAANSWTLQAGFG